eukprot:TRINITY_DN1448_c0_g1_i1.p1 TRINITY_DN1448_c0_g1~~TRINITY_DN1448_c0_g1_i1.p1  ORF type:complete len:1052 (+),score=213.47 TRINITY_DN1448_c0_g1_i1:442-3156(+)
MASSGQEGEQLVEKRRLDYKAPDFAFDTVNLKFLLGKDETIVQSKILVRPVSEDAAWSVAPLVLDGEELDLVTIKINGQPVPASDYVVNAHTLTLGALPHSEQFELEVETRIYPQKNTALEGLYKSSTGMFYTQCEAEGFRRITYFQDRPDVMSKYTVRVEADKAEYPVLLSNGNLIEEGALEGGRHFAVWEDPWAKPCYLFALVAGDLKCAEDSFTTASGKEVALRIWVQEEDVPKTGHAMRSLQASMKWDEEVFGLEYDLALFNIVAVPDFNMGAMENKSLNIFNSRLILATPETATDGDYSAIEGVVAHEYFHNWTGNRVTCRDWFQLSLKEGLTVFRDQEFSADMNSRAVERITDVVRLRASQFPQDAGPLAHPVRPDSYIKMDNFYTATVYEKGAEVVRMYQTLLGKEGFRKGMDLYFERHDGQAVTCDDFLAAMRDANNADLKGFNTWLGQAGTPTLTVWTKYDETNHTFTVHCRQETLPTPGQPEKLPVVLPLALGLLSRKDGSDMELTSLFDGEKFSSVPRGADGATPTSTVLNYRKTEQEFTFVDIAEKPVLSILRDFSAPIRLVSDATEEDLLFLLANDSNEFSRWEAGQTLSRRLMLQMVEAKQKGEEIAVPASFIEAMGTVLKSDNLDEAFLARMLTLPSESELADLMEVADPDAIHAVHKALTKTIAKSLGLTLVKKGKACRETAKDGYTVEHKSKARRALKNVCLAYLASTNEAGYTNLALKEFQSATNMTEQLGALVALAQNPGPERDQALEAFYEQWKDDRLVMNKWLGLQASSAIPGNVELCRSLLKHPAFDIKEPNKVYALLGGFCSCGVNFHAKDGSGYEFVADVVLELDGLNAQVAARMASAFTRWRKHDAQRQALAEAQLKRIVGTKGLSPNLFEIASKCLVA